jgi:hypothetical protein
VKIITIIDFMEKEDGVFYAKNNNPLLTLIDVASFG